MEIQVFYLAGNEYNEIDSVRANVPTGVDYWAIDIPEGNYTNLRIDINGGIIPIDRIAIGSEKAYHEIIHPNIHI